MSVNLLRSVSVIALTASLAMPAPVMAQAQEETAQAETCPDGSEPVAQDGSEAPVCPPGAEAAAGAADENAGQNESAAAPPEPAAQEPNTEGADASATAETAPAPETDTSAENASEPEGDASADQSSEQANQQSDIPTDEAAEQAADSDTSTAEVPASQADTPQAEQVEEADPVVTEDREAAPETAESDVQPAAEADSTGSQDAPAADAGATAGTESEPQVNADAQGEAASQAEVAQEDTAQSTSQANETVAAEAAAAASEPMDPAEADTVETVTEETARSSDEEFATKAAPATKDSSGLSNFEKFALGALGVAAAAAILNQNEEVVLSSQDRLVVRDDSGNYRVLKNDDELLRRPGSQVATKEFSDGSTRTIVTREDGVRVVTIRAPNGQVLKRSRIMPDGREIVLFDDTVDVEPVEMSFLEQFRPQERVRAPEGADELRAALLALENPADRRFSLQQIRQIRAVRDLVPEIDLDEVNFETGSARIMPEEAKDLSAIGRAISSAIKENPNEVFLIEGHTDAVGSAAMNLALSDRRAESAALALTEYFDIPPENLVVQGYGESNLKIRTNEAERANRRVAVRRITPLLYAGR